MLTVWPAEDQAVVVLVGTHSTTAGDVYDQLIEALGIDVPDEERTKPSCCDDEGEPPADEDAATELADAVERSARRAGRRR
jgi:voltage-gated potassium channel Kch